MRSDNSFKKDLMRYKSEIKSKILCDSKGSKACFNSLMNEIDNFIEDKGVTTIEEIYKQFGTAEEVATALQETVSVDTIRRKLNIKKLIAWLVVAVVAILGISMLIATMDTKDATGSYEVHDSFVEDSEVSTV